MANVIHTKYQHENIQPKLRRVCATKTSLTPTIFCGDRREALSVWCYGLTASYIRGRRFGTLLWCPLTERDCPS